ncbi:hypothetical protein OAE37_03270 [Pirellulaceae bacterium]|nr:hypothetical protein [Pirellulaceae bacterium]
METECEQKGQRPGSLHYPRKTLASFVFLTVNVRLCNRVQMVGLSALCDIVDQYPALQAGLGKWLGRWPEWAKCTSAAGSKFGLGRESRASRNAVPRIARMTFYRITYNHTAYCRITFCRATYCPHHVC